jgi:hypothetical protein
VLIIRPAEPGDQGGRSITVARAFALPLILLSAGLCVSPATAGGNDQWTALRRPLHLPKIAAGAHCPISHVDRRVPWSRINIFGGTGIGPGPVYPGLPSAFLMATRDQQYGGPWFGEKVFWYVAPVYQGPVLIRGRRLDGPQRMGFNGAKRANAELRIARGQSVTWDGQPRGSRGVPSAVRVLKPGCYGVQIDGSAFSRIVVFRVDTAS